MHSCYSFGTIPPSPYKRTCCIHPQLKEKPSIKPHKNNYSNSWVSPDWLTRSLNSITISSPKLEELVGGALFLALFKWMNLYGPIYRLVTGPKSFVILSDPAIADHVLRNYAKYSKGFLAEVSQVFIAQRPLWTMLSQRQDKSRRQRRRMGKWKQWLTAAVVVSIIVVLIKQTGSLDKEAALGFMRELKDRVGFWAIPAYIGIHTLTLALCLPYAVFFEAAASLIFGFFPALLCVFSAKVLGASLSFFIGRILFRSSSSATEWVQRNKYFHVLLRGVERDGWKFVLLARFSPIPSYVINYGLAATKVNFFVDFLLPTVIGCIPMILQNTSIGSLAGAAVSSSSSQKSRVWSYIFPLLGILSSILISIRVKKYSSLISVADDDDKSINTHDSSGHTADSAHLAEPEKKKSS